MEAGKTYKLYIQRPIKLFMSGMVIIFTVTGVLMLTGVLKDAHGNGPPWFVGLFFLLIIGFNTYYWVLRIPYQIIATSDGNVEFISLLRSKRVAAREIRSIRPHASQFGFLIVGTDSGKISILNQFDGFHRFLEWLKTNNPSVELRGC